MELADILSSLRRRWRIAVGMLLLTGAVLAGFYVTRKEEQPVPRYRAQADLLVPKRDKEGNFPDGVPPSLFFGQAALATSTSVKAHALDNAGVSADQMNAIGWGYTLNEAGDIATLTVTAATSEIAGQVAVGWGNAYSDARSRKAASGSGDQQTRTKRGLTVLDGRRRALETQMQNLDPQLATLTPGAVPVDLSIDAALLVYEHADVVARIEAGREQYAKQAGDFLLPGSYSTIVELPPVANITAPVDSPSTPTLAIIGIGLLLALALPVLIDRMDHTIRDAKTATAAFSAPVLSSIPGTTKGKTDEFAKPGTAREGAFRTLAATSVATDKLPRSIVVTSPLGVEQDAVAANFAAALAGLGVRVALVGTSPRHSWFSRNAGVSDNGHTSSTFPELLELAYSGSLNGNAPEYLQHTQIENLWVVPPGVTDIDVSTDGLAPMLQAFASANIDVTVIAAPALLQDPNTTIYAWTTRSVLWVMETGEITVEQAREGASRLALAGVTPFGVAMVDQES